MTNFILGIAALLTLSTQVIFDFDSKSDLKNWTVVNDSVMGGKSASDFKLNTDGHAVFEGKISLKNYGGFSMVRHNFKQIKLKEATKVVIRLKGDGKSYQFRVKPKSRNYYSYVTNFSTTGKWQTIEILLKNLYPYFRGDKLKRPNFSEDHIEEIAFLIGNKKEENFKLLIDKVELK